MEPWEGKSHSLVKKKKFSPEEDKILLELYKRYGEDWGRITQFMPDRTIRQVMERWKYYLDPAINAEPFTAEEDKRLIEYQTQFGNKWTKMLIYFQNRTANQLKNRWLVISRKNQSYSIPVQYAAQIPSQIMRQPTQPQIKPPQMLTVPLPIPTIGTQAPQTPTQTTPKENLTTEQSIQSLLTSRLEAHKNGTDILDINPPGPNSKPQFLPPTKQSRFRPTIDDLLVNRK